MSRSGKGFSLIELMVTMAILALLASMAVPFAQLVQQRQKETELRFALRQIRSAIDAYKMGVKEGRIESAADASGYPPNLDVLWRGVVDKSKPAASKIGSIELRARTGYFGGSFGKSGSIGSSGGSYGGLHELDAAPEKPAPPRDGVLVGRYGAASVRELTGG